MKHVGANTLVLTNSAALFQIIKPKKVFKNFIKSKFSFPEQDDFKFFSSDKVLISSVYEEASEAFGSELFGFFGSDMCLTDPQPCLSSTSQFEEAIRDISYQGPIFLALVNQKSQFPGETQAIHYSKPLQLFNYLDISDPSNKLFTRHLASEIIGFIRRSSLVSTFFGAVEEKNVDLDSFKIQAPLYIGLKNDNGLSSMGRFDLFLKIDSYCYSLYFGPNISTKGDGWKNIDFFRALYPPTFGIEPQGAVDFFPNILPYPAEGGSIFKQPFLLECLNFGHKNFLNICKSQAGALDYAGDTRGSKCLLALLGYTAKKGNILYILYLLIQLIFRI